MVKERNQLEIMIKNVRFLAFIYEFEKLKERYN